MARLNLAIPSRGNPDGLRRCINSARALAADPNGLSLYIHFSDDYAGYSHCPNWPRLTKLKSPQRSYYYAEANELFKALPTGYFVWVDDDCEFVMWGWDEYLLRTLCGGWPDGCGIVEFFSGAMKHYISHTELFRRENPEGFKGTLYPGDFIHFCGDSARHHDLMTMGYTRWEALDVDEPDRQVITHPMMANRSPEMLAARELFWERDCAALTEYVGRRSSNPYADTPAAPLNTRLGG